MVDSKRLAIGQRLREARSAKGYTLQQLADAAGYGRAAISGAEHGRSVLRPQAMIAIAKLLGISIDWLMTGDGAS